MQAVTQKPTPAPSRLGVVHKGRIAAPRRYVIYGPEGVGKSTLAAGAPDPIWIDVEEGSSDLNVGRYSFRDGVGGHVPQSYDDVLAALDDLTTGDHAFKTLVIDTADRLESLMHAWLCRRDRKANVEAYGYAKGYNVALDEWRALCLRLDRLRAARGMNVILLAHAQIRTFKSPETEDYDRYNLRIHDKAAGFVKEWSDVVGFLNFEGGAAKADGANRAKGYLTGRRMLYLSRTAAYDAKGRGMPDSVPVDQVDPWAPLAAAVSQQGDPAALVALIEAELVKLTDDAVAAKVRTATETASKAGDASALSRYLERVRELNNTPVNEETK